MPKIGDRVGAILSMKDDEVQFLGYGVYEGDKIPPGMPSFDDLFPEAERKKIPENDLAFMRKRLETMGNPRIKLDNGEFVWGMECWWGPENDVKERIATSNVIMCKIVRDERGVGVSTEIIQ